MGYDAFIGCKDSEVCDEYDIGSLLGEGIFKMSKVIFNLLRGTSKSC